MTQALVIDAPDLARALVARGATVVEGDDVNLMLAHWGHLDILVTAEPAQAVEAARHMAGRGRGAILWRGAGEPPDLRGVQLVRSLEEIR